MKEKIKEMTINSIINDYASVIRKINDIDFAWLGISKEQEIMLRNQAKVIELFKQATSNIRG